MANKTSKIIRAREEKLRMGIIFALSLIFILTSCQQKTFDNRDELMAYVANTDNGYTQHKSVNGTDFSITYRPTDMLVRQELTEEMSRAQVDSLRQKYEPYLYFNLSLSKNNKEVLSNMSNSRADFGAMVNQLAFGMGVKVHLFSQKKDTIELLDYVYPREYGMGRATNIMLVYPKDEKLMKDEFVHFTIEDIGIKTGEVGFKIPIEPIRNEPELKFE